MEGDIATVRRAASPFARQQTRGRSLRLRRFERPHAGANVRTTPARVRRHGLPRHWRNARAAAADLSGVRRSVSLGFAKVRRKRERIAPAGPATFNAEANGIGLVSKAALDCGSVKFPQGFQKGRRSDNRCEIAGRGGEIPKD